MKRIYAILLAAVLLVGTLVCLPFSVAADSEEDFTYEIADGKATVTGYVGNGGSYGYVVLPDTLGGAAVTAIGDGAFDSVQSIYGLALPNSIKTIGDGAFRNCTFLKSVNIPTGTVSIGDEAFLDCTWLTELQIPANVTHIGSDAFLGCGQLESIAVAEGNAVYHAEGDCLIETATNTLLKGCANSVIPEGVTTIARGAFAQCTQLQRIDIPESVTTIEDQAFYCAHLKEIFLPKSVRSIGQNVFDGNSFLERITVDGENTVYHAEGDCLIETETGTLLRGCINSVIPDGVTRIGERAFRSVHDLFGIVIPEGVTEIGAHAFAECYKLSVVSIPDSVTSIGEGAFSGIYYLRSVFIPAGVKSMGANAFDGEGLEHIYCGASAKPEGWSDAWMERYETSGQTITVHWDAERPPFTLSLGDIDGDGKINSTDYLLLKRYCLGTFTLAGLQKAVADVSKDGKVNSVDYLLVKRHVLGTFVIG